MCKHFATDVLILMLGFVQKLNLGQERPVTEKQFDKDVVVETATW